MTDKQQLIASMREKIQDIKEDIRRLNGRILKRVSVMPANIIDTDGRVVRAAYFGRIWDRFDQCVKTWWIIPDENFDYRNEHAELRLRIMQLSDDGKREISSYDTLLNREDAIIINRQILIVMSMERSHLRESSNGSYHHFFGDDIFRDICKTSSHQPHSRGESTMPDIDNNNTVIIATSNTTDKNINYDSDAVHRAIEEFNRKKSVFPPAN